jgi:hypothetical protein
VTAAGVVTIRGGYSRMTSYRIIGGACFIDHWRYMVSTPLVILSVDDVGARFDLRPQWFEAFVKMGMKFSLQPFKGEAMWAAGWADIVGARLAGPTVVLKNRQGERCRFIAESADELVPLIDGLREHRVQMQIVRSTFLDVYLNRQWPV